MKQAKRTLVLSAIVLLLSVAMLAGATFAWFTDSVTNSGNKIEAGKLEVDLLQKTSTLSAAQQAEITAASDKPLTTEDGFTVISALTSPVFNYSLWEPGYSTGAVFKVKNSGTLAFKFGFAFASLEVTQNLGNVLIVSVNGEDKGTLSEFATGTPFFSGILGSGMTSAELDIVIRMDTSAGNDYQGATAKFDLVLKAVQTSLEEDGFGNADYDAAAPEGWVDAPKADSVVVPVTPGEDTTIVNPDYPAKAEIPAEALADNATSLTFSIIETESVPEGVTVNAGQEAMPFDIKVDGLKADNASPIAVSLFVGKHLLDVSVYHHAVLLTAETDNFAYDPETGFVRFTTKSFSPFTVTCYLPAVKANDGYYRSLNDAWDACATTSNVTMTLLSDTVEASAMEISAGQTVVLDFQGYTVTVAETFSFRLFANYGTLTLKGDGTVDVTNAEANGYGTVNNFGILTVEDGTYINLKESNASTFYNRKGGTAYFLAPTIYGGGGCVATESDTVTEIRGGYYQNETNPAVENRGDMLITAGEFVNSSCSSCDKFKWGYTVRSGENSDTAHLVIDGATDDAVRVTGVQGGLAVIGGTAEIHNGDYKTVPCKVHPSGTSAFYAGYFSGESYETATTIYGGTFSSCSKTAILVGNGNPAPDSGAGEHSTVMIKGGTFLGGDKNKTAVTVNNIQYAIGAAHISGGTFSSDPRAYLATGYRADLSGERWIVTQVASNPSTIDSYEALADAVSYGGSIVLDRGIAISPQGPDANTLFPQLVVNKDTTIDLKGTLNVQSSPSDNWTYTPAMFAVTSGTLTINGNGTLSAEAGNNNSYGINVNGGTVVINGGNYFGAPTALQVQEGTAIINGGFFDLAPSPKTAVPQCAKYVVNVIDSAYKDGSASLMIYGGTFVNFDPSANPEGAGTSYVAEGYTVISEEQDNGDIWYTVVKLSETQN